MIKIFKAFDNSEKYFVVFDFNNSMVKMMTKEELNNRFLEYKIEGTLVPHAVEDAWDRASFYVEDDRSLVYLLFVKDLKGVFHRLKFGVYDDGKVTRNSLVLGTNDTVMKNEFGKGLL